MAAKNPEKPEIAITKGKSPKECVLNGLGKLGGMSKYINKGDHVFIKINASLPNGYPVHVNLDVLEGIIRSCHEVGAAKINVGSFPIKPIAFKEISDFLGLERYLKDLDVELIFLDNSNYYSQRNLEELQHVKNDSLSLIEVNGKEYKFPKIILDSDKLISLNQVNVHPLFDLSLSLLNSYSMVPESYPFLKAKLKNGKDSSFLVECKRMLIDNILDVFMIKRPDLVINDLYHVLEGAGPYIFKDSNLKEVGASIIGNDAFYTDLLTLKILGFNLSNNEMISSAKERGLGTYNYSGYIIYDDVKETEINIENCILKLSDINVKNVSINQGEICAGCFEQAYYLLNFMKTYMTKDLIYISKNAFLLGENPPLPESSSRHVILFGNCACESIKDENFKKLTHEGKKKTKMNKNILQLTGCPPNYLDCIHDLLNYYGKQDAPSLNLLIETLQHSLSKKKEDWEDL